MSSFTCNFCGVAIVDSPRGYLTGCKHFPSGKIKPGTHVSGNLIRHVLPDGRINEIDCGVPLRARVVYP
jgi:hypothetical protein